jgi:hypothetical protein
MTLPFNAARASFSMTATIFARYSGHTTSGDIARSVWEPAAYHAANGEESANVTFAFMSSNIKSRAWVWNNDLVRRAHGVFKASQAAQICEHRFH